MKLANFKPIDRIKQPFATRVARLNSHGLTLATSQMDMIKQQASLVQQDYLQSQCDSFHEKYVLGDKLGEGQHASVYKCYQRVTATKQTCTPLPKNELLESEYLPETYAVKIVRDDDCEKISA